MMYGGGKSDPGIVAVKLANNAEPSAAESVEPRTGTKGNADQQSTRQAQDWESGHKRWPAWTGQGTVISPLLANVYLHYSLDLWAEHWRRREATGDMIIVRYADDGAPRRRKEEVT